MNVQTDLDRSEWSTAFMNDLPDSSFAYIAPGGEKDADGKTTPRTLRYLPYKDADGKIDLPHLRNALARLTQTALSDEAQAEAQKKLVAAAKTAGVGEYAEKDTGKRSTEESVSRSNDAQASSSKLTFFAPITRIDQATREIEGVMTSEKIDTYETVFDYDRSKIAGKNWVGNIREQHDPHKAVGRRVSMTFDDATRSVTLRSRISTGAEDTWQKILDGTLVGYSISCSRYAPPEMRTIGNKTIPVYTDYDYNEVSVVDSPSNPDSALGIAIFRSDGIDPSTAFEDLEPPAQEAALEEQPTQQEGTQMGMTSLDQLSQVAEALARSQETPLAEEQPIQQRPESRASGNDGMMQDTGYVHTPHDHQHATSYGSTHDHDHVHTHTDGTQHTHPHMHEHNHHDHFNDPNHSHDHTHVHSHDHIYRSSAPDTSVPDPLTRAIDTSTGLDGHDPNTGGMMINADGTHKVASMTHTHPHANYGTRADGTVHEHEHTHLNDANHQHEHAEEERSTSQSDLERAGKRVSNDTKVGLHAARDSILRTCGCDECQQMLEICDPDMDGDDDTTPGLDTDADAVLNRKRQARLIRAAANMALSKAIAPITAQFRSIAARLATVPDTQTIHQQLHDLQTSLEGVAGVVQKIAKQEIPGGPVLRAADRTSAIGSNTVYDASVGPNGLLPSDIESLSRLAQSGLLQSDEQGRIAALVFKQQYQQHK